MQYEQMPMGTSFREGTNGKSGKERGLVGRLDDEIDATSGAYAARTDAIRDMFTRCVSFDQDLVALSVGDDVAILGGGWDFGSNVVVVDKNVPHGLPFSPIKGSIEVVG